MTQLNEAHVVVLGAGYGGLRAAFDLARHVRVTLIDPADSFTERVRLHERAAGREDVRHALWPLLRASGVTHLAARVSRIDTAAAEVHTGVGRVVGYDRLVYALGSRTGDPGPAGPGRVFTAETAAELHRRLLGDPGRLTVVGGGLTGIETAAELAESHPGVYVAGDAAAAHTRVSGPLRMACATALPLGLHAARSVVRDLGGLEPRPLAFSYVSQCMSLGRRDGLLQFVDKDDSPRDRILTGRVAALVKEQIVRTTVRTIAMTARHPRAARLIPGVN
jgi:NADH dehydrogenase FAD-containing subunit